ncbi:MAG: hypothetical protein PHT92_09170 [Bacteroidales bacterium]|jgi:Na+-transporting NADH:ubiquinone oxidoreductase subunit NqrF|nr:hypothetical protein [Bacteroidales bacterium]
MKKIGIIILGIGLLITIVTSVSFVTREKVVDVGDINISRNKNHSLAWSPIVGIVAMVVGGGLLLIGLKKK